MKQGKKEVFCEQREEEQILKNAVAMGSLWITARAQKSSPEKCESAGTKAGQPLSRKRCSIFLVNAWREDAEVRSPLNPRIHSSRMAERCVGITQTLPTTLAQEANNILAQGGDIR